MLHRPPPNRPIRLKNVTCPFCGVGLEETASTEHVIGRRFVPRGKFNNHWNLLVAACTKCNNAKSELEDDLSALTMQPDVAGRFAADDERLLDEARRKGAGSFSRRTRKPVAQSQERLSITGSVMPGVTVRFGFVGPPQLDEARAYKLA